MNRRFRADDITKAFVRATSRYLRMRKGLDVVKLLSRSMRVFEDLTEAMEFGEDHFSALLCLREWNEEMVKHPEYEFRCFVYNDKINAIT